MEKKICNKKPCKKYKRLRELTGGIDAIVYTDEKNVYRKLCDNEIKNITNDEIKKIINKLIKNKVILDYNIKKCGKIYWLVNKYEKTKLDKNEKRSWEILVELLAKFHNYAKEVSCEVTKGSNWFKDKEELYEKSYCHMDLHEDNIIGGNKNFYILDIWEMEINYLDIDLAITLLYSYTYIQDPEHIIKLLNVYNKFSKRENKVKYVNLYKIKKYLQNVGPSNFNNDVKLNLKKSKIKILEEKINSIK